MTPANALKLPAGTRSGLMTRAGFLLNKAGTGGENPVLRGVRIREDILCLHTDPPPPDIAAQVTAPAYDPSMTVRERYAAKTSAANCISCHRAINPLGFALTSYNGFGLWKNGSEPVFNADGTYANRSLPVDPKVDLAEVVGPGAYADNPHQFSTLIASRPEARRCFTEAYAQHALGRLPDVIKDGCRLNRLYRATSTQMSLKDFMKSLAYDVEFRLRKLEPQ